MAHYIQFMPSGFYKLNSVNRPVIVRVASNHPDIKKIALNVVIRNPTMAVGIFKYVWMYSDYIVQTLPGNYKVFQFDLSKVLSDHITYDIPDNDMINNIVKYRNDTNASRYIQVIAHEVISNANGLLTMLSVPVISNPFLGVNSVRQVFERWTMTDYYQTGAGLPYRWLTNKPLKSKVNIDESEWVSLYADMDSNGVSIITYNAAGAVLQRGIWFFNPFGQHVAFNGIRIDGLVTLKVGPRDLLRMVYDVAGITTLNNVASYSVTVGRLTNFLGTGIWCAVPYVPVRTYYIDQHSCEPMRVVFMNAYGRFDSYTFRLVEEGVVTKLTTYEKPTPVLQVDSGATRGETILSKTGTRVYEVRSNDLSAFELLWLREVLTSPEVYVFNTMDNLGNCALYAITVEADQYPITEDEETGLKQITLKFRLSHPVETQRN